MTIPPSVAINTLFPCAHLPLRVYICPREFALEFAIARLPSQDFTCDLLVVTPYCRTLLAIHPWSIIIARLCLRSICGQISLQDFACNPPLAKYPCRTLCDRFLIIWQSTLGQSSSHDCCLAILQTNLGQPAIAPSVSDRSAIYPSSPAP